MGGVPAKLGREVRFPAWGGVAPKVTGRVGKKTTIMLNKNAGIPPLLLRELPRWGRIKTATRTDIPVGEWG